MNRTAIAAALAAALLLPAAAKADDAPGVFKVPGTDSTIKFYGYVQLDATEDFGGRGADYEDNDWATFLPNVPADNSPYAKRAKPQLYLTARTSRFGIQTNTPSPMGNVGVKLEGDFNAPNGFQSETFTNSTLFRLRHAYGTIGNLLVGQTWTTFLDFGAAPDTVDFNGPGTLALVRNPMIRYTIPFGDGMGLALAAENTRGPQFSYTDQRFQVLPDLHANFSWNGAAGSFSARVVGQQLNRLVLTGTGQVADVSPKSAFGLGFGVSGSVKLGGDTLQAQFAGGPGIGRYLLNAAAVPFVSFNSSGDAKLWTVYGFHAAYTHIWSPEFRSTLCGAYTMIQDPKINGVAASDGTPKNGIQGFANLFWTTTKTTEFGIEYAYGQWKDIGGDKGTQNRVNASMHYSFY